MTRPILIVAIVCTATSLFVLLVSVIYGYVICAQSILLNICYIPHKIIQQRHVLLAHALTGTSLIACCMVIVTAAVWTNTTPSAKVKNSLAALLLRVH